MSIKSTPTAPESQPRTHGTNCEIVPKPHGVYFYAGCSADPFVSYDDLWDAMEDNCPDFLDYLEGAAERYGVCGKHTEDDLRRPRPEI